MWAVIAIGTNLGSRQLNVAHAIKAIEDQVGTILRRSRIMETEALVPEERAAEIQPAYLNCAILVETNLKAPEILVVLHNIESQLGRDRSKEKLRWSPRIIDLDLICCDSEVIDTPGLKLPHPEMHKRSFVLQPMLEVWPEWRHPLIEKSAAEIYNDLRL